MSESGRNCLIWQRWSASTSFKYFSTHKYNYLTTIYISEIFPISNNKPQGKLTGYIF